MVRTLDFHSSDHGSIPCEIVYNLNILKFLNNFIHNYGNVILFVIVTLIIIILMLVKLKFIIKISLIIKVIGDIFII